MLNMKHMLPPELRRELITNIVTSWEFKNPGLKQAAFQEVREAKLTRRTKFAEVEGKDDMDLRLMVRLPLGLWKMFDTLVNDPKIFVDKEELTWFMKKYRGYVVPEKL